MIISIDIGNSDIVFGIFINNNLIYTMRMEANKNMKGGDYYLFFLNELNKYIKQHAIVDNIDNIANNDMDIVNNTIKTIKGVVISSVVPLINDNISDFVKRYLKLKPLFVTHKNCNINIAIPSPEKMGTDIVSNAVAALTLYKRDMIIVDFGTATTLSVARFNAKSKDAIYDTTLGIILGAIIMPGIKSSMHNLVNSAAQLFEVNIMRPNKVLGINTESAIQSGVYYGAISSVEGLIQRLKKEIAIDLDVVVTGGFSNIIDKRDSDAFDIINPNLTLYGIYMIYCENCENKE